jgi:hypothetical protein
MTMGFEGDGDPPTGRTGAATDVAEFAMDLEEALDEVAGQFVENSGRSSLQTEGAKTAGTFTTGM